MIELEDCGKELALTFWGNFDTRYAAIRANAKIIMVIKAPRGSMALFGHEAMIGKNGKYMFKHQTRQCDAIRAFMREHFHD